ncbi:MAG: FkbM family methyltransferase [Lachnospiraceae bacterium]|nr:FkbM family methyltransferase [Lachnospiraceae bacterium]
MKKAIIYGTGNYYAQNKEKLPKDLEIVAYADSNPNNATSHNGKLFKNLPMLLPEEFETVAYDVVYICTEYTAGNIIFQRLSVAGIGSDRIFFLNRIDGSVDWEYKTMEDRKGYLSTVDGITVQERYLTDFDIVVEVLINNSYGFSFTDEDYIVIDIGMNVAIASLYFAKQPNVKKVYGFEAFPDTYEQAVANIALNPPEIRDKIVAENFALSDENGKMMVAVSAEETGWRNIFSRDESKRQVGIVCRDAGEVVSDILNRHKEKIILKVDTEGAEFIIFEALERAGCFEKIDVIMMEYHGDSGKLIPVLKKYGYKFFIHGKRTVCGLIHAVK